MSIEISPLSDSLGLKITNINLKESLSSEAIQEIHNAWLEGGVICIPGQDLDEGDQVKFGQLFGELATTQGEYQISKSHPSIMYVTNEKENGEYIGALPDGEMYFHSDMCYVEKPSMATILYGMHIPSAGGNTLFANMYAAYNDLEPALQSRLTGLKALNSYEPGTSAPMKSTRMTSQPSSNSRSFLQPMVCTHPITQRKALYVNRLMTEYVDGLSRSESDDLLQFLFDHQEQKKYIYEHQWNVGDLVMWDNRCVLHARSDFDAGELRKLRRVTVKGDRIS